MDIGIFAIIKEAEKILLVKDATRQNLWTLPGGGLELGELVTGAITREVREETSLIVEPAQLLGIFSQQKTPGIVILFETKIIEGTAKPDGEETSECRFYSWEELVQVKQQVKPAQFSMIYQVLNTKIFPIFNNFVTPKE